MDGGSAEVAVSQRLVVGDGQFKCEVVTECADRVLIEFPRESSTGRWREWVSRDLFTAGVS